MMGQPSPAPARAFTILEVVLAASIGAMVVLTATSLFAVINRSESEAVAHYQQTLEITQTHEMMQRAMRLIVTTDAPPPITAPSGDGTAARDEPEEGEPPSPDDSQESALPTPTSLAQQGRPRFLLERDPRYGTVLATSEGLAQPQRFEVALRAAPIFVKPFAGLEESVEEERLRLEAMEGDLSLLVPGVRGAFELEYDAGRDAAPGRAPRPAGWTLWWRQLRPSPAAGGLTDEMVDPLIEALHRGDFEDEDLPPGAIRLATGLASVQWEVYRDSEFHREMRATWSEDLPAFVKAKIVTIDGRVYDWMFEIGWTLGPDPGTLIVDRATEDATMPPERDEAETGDEEAEGVSAAEEFLRALENDGGEVEPAEPPDESVPQPRRPGRGRD